MNKVELKENPRPGAHVIQNLNRGPTLPFGDAEFDGVGCCAFMDYLIQPVEVLRGVGRAPKVGSPSTPCKLRQRYLGSPESRRIGSGRGECCPLKAEPSSRATASDSLEGRIR